MERINMAKYGFIRSPKDDFSDDGTRFYCYRIGDHIRVSKATDRGVIYLSGRLERYDLDYEEFSKLPHYRSLDKLNGVSMSSVTEQDLIDLYNNCITYEQEYEAAVAKIIHPTEAQIRSFYEKYQQHEKSELAWARAAIVDTIDSIMHLDEYYYREIKQCFNNLEKRVAQQESINKLVANYKDSAYMRKSVLNPEIKSSYDCERIKRFLHLN